LLCVHLSKESIQDRGLIYYFRKSYLLQRGDVSTSPNRKAGWLLFCCLRPQYKRSYPLHLQSASYIKSEDAPCHGERDPLNTDNNIIHTGVLN